MKDTKADSPMDCCVEPWGMNFMEAVATVGPSDALVAGWLVCTVVAAALAHGKMPAALAGAARSRLRCMDQLPLRRQLSELLRHADPASPNWPRPAARELIVYGIRLFHDGIYGAARDVFGIVAQSPYLLPDTRLWGMDRRASAARSNGDFVYAAMAYNQMERHAVQWGDTRQALRARIGEAMVALAVKDFEEAERILRQTLVAAQHCMNRDAVARCQANLGFLAGERGDHAAAYSYSIAAADGLPTEAARQRARVNAAESLRNLGHPDEARVIALDVLATSRDSAARAEAEYTLSRIGPAPAVLEPATPAEIEELRPMEAVLSRVVGA